MDLLLSESGDLVFEKIDLEKRRVRIDFYVSKASVIKIGFEITNCKIQKVQKNGLTVQFSFKNINSDKKSMLASGDALLKQKILIAIKTSIGELKHRLDVGSIVETLFHENITNEKVISKLKETITEIVKRYDATLNVEIYPYINRDSEYKQALIADVKRTNTSILKYEVE